MKTLNMWLKERNINESYGHTAVVQDDNVLVGQLEQLATRVHGIIADLPPAKKEALLEKFFDDVKILLKG